MSVYVLMMFVGTEEAGVSVTEYRFRLVKKCVKML